MFNPHTSRRQWLQQTACGFGSLALAGLCQQQAEASAPASSGETPSRSGNSLLPKSPHFAAKAKRVIFLFMQGGPSQIDTFDYKPRLTRDDGKKVTINVARTRKVTQETMLGSPWKFKQYGERGQWVSELFPHQAKLVDELCVIRSMHTEGVAHGPATLFLHCGAGNLVRPSMGSWVVYGLGTENQNLPGFVTINPTLSKGGPRNYSNAFLPTIYQGTTVGRAEVATHHARIRNLTNDWLAPAEQRRQLDLLAALNREQLRGQSDDDELEATIESFEMAYRMQMNAPQTLDIAGETQATLDLYGIGPGLPTDDFGRQCLMARKLAESDVRYIQINYSDNTTFPRWDQHSKMIRHADHALAIDQPVAALLTDLKARGLLEDTLVWWGGEFGRTPYAEGRDGRDHNPNGFTMWLAGGGVKGGTTYGETDEYGYNAVVDKVHMHDLHATILHLMGLDHERLTYQYAGRNFRLTDVHGSIVKGILA